MLVELKGIEENDIDHELKIELTMDELEEVVLRLEELRDQKAAHMHLFSDDWSEGHFSNENKSMRVGHILIELTR